MKKVAAVLLTVALMSTYASAGTVVFTSANPTIDVAAPGPVSFDVTLHSADGAGFETVDMVIGSDLAIQGWAFSPAALSSFTSTLFLDDGGVFDKDIFVNATNQTAVGSGILFGTVTLNPPASMSIGQTFDVFVNAGIDGFSGLGRGGVGDPLNGSARVTVVPEPATMTLLGLAAVGLIRRRRAA